MSTAIATPYRAGPSHGVDSKYGIISTIPTEARKLITPAVSMRKRSPVVCHTKPRPCLMSVMKWLGSRFLWVAGTLINTSVPAENTYDMPLTRNISGAPMVA